MIERQKHLDAFAYFLSLGGIPSRDNCIKVADKLQISERTFWNWYKKLDWKSRTQGITTEASQEVTENAVHLMAEQKEAIIIDLQGDRKKTREFRAKLHRAFEFLGDRINDGALVAKDISEVAQLVNAYSKMVDCEEKEVKLMLLLAGEVDSRVDHGIVMEFPGVDFDNLPE